MSDVRCRRLAQMKNAAKGVLELMKPIAETK
jgi:hypothetical protein